MNKAFFKSIFISMFLGFSSLSSLSFKQVIDRHFGGPVSAKDVPCAKFGDQFGADVEVDGDVFFEKDFNRNECWFHVFFQAAVAYAAANGDQKLLEILVNRCQFNAPDSIQRKFVRMILSEEFLGLVISLPEPTHELFPDLEIIANDQMGIKAQEIGTAFVMHEFAGDDFITYFRNIYARVSMLARERQSNTLTQFRELLQNYNHSLLTDEDKLSDDELYLFTRVFMANYGRGLVHVISPMKLGNLRTIDPAGFFVETYSHEKPDIKVLLNSVKSGVRPYLVILVMFGHHWNSVIVYKAADQELRFFGLDSMYSYQFAQKASEKKLKDSSVSNMGYVLKGLQAIINSLPAVAPARLFDAAVASNFPSIFKCLQDKTIAGSGVARASSEDEKSEDADLADLEEIVKVVREDADQANGVVAFLQQDIGRAEQELQEAKDLAIVRIMSEREDLEVGSAQMNDLVDSDANVSQKTKELQALKDQVVDAQTMATKAQADFDKAQQELALVQAKLAAPKKGERTKPSKLARAPEKATADEAKSPEKPAKEPASAATIQAVPEVPGSVTPAQAVPARKGWGSWVLGWLGWKQYDSAIPVS